MSERVIICYGDSNTAGQQGMQGDQAVFHPLKNHWPQRVQGELEEFKVITNAVPGRTAGNIGDEELHGLAHFEGALRDAEQAGRIEHIIVALGVNDLQNGFERPAGALIADLGSYAAKASSYYPDAGIIFVGIADYKASEYMTRDTRREQVNNYLASRFAYVTTEDVEHGPDGVHYSSDDHGKVAAKVLDIIRETEVGIYAW